MNLVDKSIKNPLFFTPYHAYSIKVYATRFFNKNAAL